MTVLPLPDDFAAEALYAADAWFVHGLREIDAASRRVVAHMDTTRLGPLVDAQREVSGHQKHVPAAMVIQATGTMGQLYAVYALGLRATEGWSGYGTHIREARFHRMGLIGPPITVSVTATKQRQMMGTWFCEFDFAFVQDGQPVYTSKQSAAWRKLSPGA
jgi:3-hydroxymyristoyl/3-hydroxydecanoyl-(acyl carrier protein) dehydratase